MKRFLGCLLVLVLLLGMASAQAETFYSRQIDFCNESVTLRNGPSGSAGEICQVGIGEVVMAAPYNSEFSFCCYNGFYGYIKSQYLSSYIMPYSEGVFGIDFCDSWVTLRAMPDTSAEAIARIPKGAVLDQIFYNDCADGPYMPGAFAYVRYNGQYGFVLWDFITCLQGQ